MQKFVVVSNAGISGIIDIDNKTDAARAGREVLNKRISFFSLAKMESVLRFVRGFFFSSRSASLDFHQRDDYTG